MAGKGKGEAALGANSLRVEVEGADWYLTIRRKDRKAQGFHKWNGKPIGPAELATFLPGHAALAWAEVETPPGADRDFAAEDGDHRVDLFDRTKKRSVADAAAAFASFMT